MGGQCIRIHHQATWLQRERDCCLRARCFAHFLPFGVSCVRAETECVAIPGAQPYSRLAIKIRGSSELFVFPLTRLPRCLLPCTSVVWGTVLPMELAFANLLRSFNVQDSVILALCIHDVRDRQPVCTFDATEEGLKTSAADFDINLGPGGRGLSHKRELARLVTAQKQAKVQSDVKLNLDAVAKALGEPVDIMAAVRVMSCFSSRRSTARNFTEEEVLLIVLGRSSRMERCVLKPLPTWSALLKEKHRTSSSWKQQSRAASIWTASSPSGRNAVTSAACRKTLKHSARSTRLCPTCGVWPS